MERSKSGKSAAVTFIISSILSVIAGIASVIMMFMKWVELDLFGVYKEQYRVIDFYTIAKTLKEMEAELQGVVGSQISVPGLQQVKLASLGIMVAAGVIILLQLMYVVTVVTGKENSRTMGIIVGVLTLVLAVVAVVLFYWMNARISAWVNTGLDSVNGVWNQLNDVLSMININIGTANLQFDLNQFFYVTPFPLLTGGLGLLEAIFAR